MQRIGIPSRPDFQMFIEKVKYSALWTVCGAVSLLAGASIIVGLTKSLMIGGFTQNPFAKLGYLLGAHMGILDWYPNSPSVVDNFLSAIGIASIVSFVIAVSAGVFSRRRVAELNQVSRSLRTERLKSKYR